MKTVGTCVLFLAVFCGIEATTKTYHLPYRSGGVDYTLYNLYDDGIRIDATTSVVFNTKGENDCHLLLQQDSNNYYSNVIEIVIGGWGNSQSVIRTSQQGSHQDTYKESGILSSSVYRTFWISWANNCIRVGKGSTVGSGEFMGWCGLSHAINYLSIGYGYGSDGYFQFTITPFLAATKTYHLPYQSGGVDYTLYNLYNDGIRIDASTSVVFNTKGKNDCHLLLQKDSDNYNSNVIEIVIGGWSNSQSVIRTSQQGSHKDTYKESGILSSSSYRTFWISWANKCIRVGKGPEVGSSEFMGWCGLSHAINYLSIGYGYGSDGYFQFTITLTPEETEFIKVTCPADANAHVLAPGTQCRSFWQCLPQPDGSFKIAQSDCPAGTLWSVVANTCGHEAAVTCEDTGNSKPKDCKGITQPANSGAYEIYPNGNDAVKVYCDFKTYGEPWTVIQSRHNKEDFQKSWEEYVKGFAYSEKDYWIGLETLHALTGSGEYRLRIDMEDDLAGVKYAQYEMFSVGDESTGYQLKVGEYDGDAGDMLKYHHGAPFSTYDHYYGSHNCAKQYGGGGFWYKNCLTVNPNGIYGSRYYASGVVYRTASTFRRSLQWLEMKIQSKA